MKEGMVLALIAFIAQWMVKEQCWVVEEASEQITEYGKGEVNFMEFSQRFDVNTCRFCSAIIKEEFVSF